MDIELVNLKMPSFNIRKQDLLVSEDNKDGTRYNYEDDFIDNIHDYISSIIDKELSLEPDTPMLSFMKKTAVKITLFTIACQLRRRHQN